MDIQNYIKKIFEIKTLSNFNECAIEAFHYQYNNNTIYNRYVQLIGYKIKKITKYTQIPFLPIELFRQHLIKSSNNRAEAVFHSSGTTTQIKSKHHVIDLSIYKKSILKTFELFLGKPEKYVFLCLVPELKYNKNSSLAFMCDLLIKKSNNSKSGFYIKKKDTLISAIKSCQIENKPFILLGLSFEILNFSEKNNISLHGGFVIETGGTKKKDKHIIQADLHQQLKSKFNIHEIYSEYGMAELLTQSYYLNEMYFKSPNWKKILIRDRRNPLKIIRANHRGCINIIDLANIYSCCFIATNDIGYTINKGFNILGRAQNASERGCNLLI